MDRVRLALVGCGGIAGAHAAALWRLEDRYEVVACCDVVPDLAAARARQVRAREVVADWRALVERADVEAVDVCLPHHLHAEVALAFLDAGKHVLVEKPIATDLGDARRMVEAARQRDRVLMVGHNERYDPQYRAMKRILDEGRIGEVQAVRADHNQDVRRPGHWLTRLHEAGGGVVIGSGIHRMDLMRWLVGEVDTVYQVQGYVPERMEGEVYAFTVLRFRNGALGELACHWAVRRYPWYEMMWFYGSRGSVHNVGGVKVEYEGSGGVLQCDVSGADSFTEELREFADAIREGRRPLTDGEEGLETLRVVLAGYRSAAEGRPVWVAEVGG
jgi:predicted dehydrogenase